MYLPLTKSGKEKHGLMSSLVAAFALVTSLGTFAADQRNTGEIGKQLVDKHCTRCHLAPDPADLPLENWPITLHWMGNYVGMKGDEFSDLPMQPVMKNHDTLDDYTIRYNLVDARGKSHFMRIFKEWILPKPAMSKTEWLQVRAYFEKNSRPLKDMLYEQKKQPLLKGFTATVPPLDLEPNGLVFTMKVDESKQRLYVGRGIQNDWIAGGIPGVEGIDALLSFDLKSGKRIGYTQLETDPATIELTQTGLRVSTHGQMPVVIGNGKGQVIDFDHFGDKDANTHMLINGMHRVTEHITQDLNSDGLEDILVTSFGDGLNHTGGGGLSIYWQTPEFATLRDKADAQIPQGPLEGALDETVLLTQAGMLGAAVEDFNKDGLPDVLVVSAQAHQQILIFINQGNKLFKRHEVLEHTPSFGSTGVEIADLNNDGHMDILLMNGNNVEMKVLRAQHGIRIFENNGDLSFTQRFVYPMHGATRSVVNDFDNDGDLDIATISLWPDWSMEEPETFIYLENKGDWKFSPASLDAAYWGVWSSIEVGDVNADSKTDIILGLGNYPSLLPPDWTSKKIMSSRKGKAPTVTFLLNKN
ncbi:MAG: VCBS repeat-containing protein [Gammaproteobacteria bacterium]|jgi:hypothetical protein|nr:VCBS repeat-containing protein [Gammaproteobacteria bacterium]